MCESPSRAPTAFRNVLTDTRGQSTGASPQAEAKGAETKKKAIPKVSVQGLGCLYDGQPHPASGTVTGTQGELLGVPSLSYNGKAEAPTDAGTYALVGSFAGNEAYEAATSQEPAELVIQAVPQDVDQWQWKPPRLKFGETLDIQGLQVTGAIGAVGCPEAGSKPPRGGPWKIVLTAAGDHNHLSASKPFILDVLRATPTVSVQGSAVKYDGQPHAGSGTVMGINGEDLGKPTLSYNGKPEIPTDAGTYALVGSFAGNESYEAATSQQPAELIIQAVPQDVDQWQWKPPRLKFGETLDIQGLQVTGAVGAIGCPEAGSKPPRGGPWKIVLTAAGDQNHLPASKPVILDVARATPTVSVQGSTVKYDGKPHVGSGTVEGVDGEDLGKPSLSYNGKPEAPTDAGSYVLVGNFAGNENYELASSKEPANLVIDPAKQDPKRWTWQPAPIAYGEALEDKHLSASGYIGKPSYTPDKGTAAPKPGPWTLTLVAEGDQNHQKDSLSITVQVQRAQAKIQFTPPKPIVWGQTLADLGLKPIATPPSTPFKLFHVTSGQRTEMGPKRQPPVGQHSLQLVVEDSDEVYGCESELIPIKVDPVVPTLTLGNPGPINTGDRLSATGLVPQVQPASLANQLEYLLEDADDGSQPPGAFSLLPEGLNYKFPFGGRRRLRVRVKPGPSNSAAFQEVTLAVGGADWPRAVKYVVDQVIAAFKRNFQFSGPSVNINPRDYPADVYDREEFLRRVKAAFRQLDPAAAIPGKGVTKKDCFVVDGASHKGNNYNVKVKKELTQQEIAQGKGRDNPAKAQIHVVYD